jgi:hypothetical protein
VANQTIKPNYSASDAAWLAAYVARNGTISLNVGGHAATVQANGWIVVEDREVSVATVLAVPMTTQDVAAVEASAVDWVASWRASGAAGVDEGRKNL